MFWLVEGDLWANIISLMFARWSWFGNQQVGGLLDFEYTSVKY